MRSLAGHSRRRRKRWNQDKRAPWLTRAAKPATDIRATNSGFPQLDRSVPAFDYNYPYDIPVARQKTIQSNVEYATGQFRKKAKILRTEREFQKARQHWFWQVVSPAADVIGTLAITAEPQWDVNRIKARWEGLCAAAAKGAGISWYDAAVKKELRDTEEWRRCQASLCPELMSTDAPNLTRVITQVDSPIRVPSPEEPLAENPLPENDGGACQIAGNSSRGPREAIHMLPSKREIEQLVNEIYVVACDDILNEHAMKRMKLMSEARLSGNGASLPVLTACEAEFAGKMMLAWADAYIDAFTTYRMPCDHNAQAELLKTAKQIAAGAIASVQGDFELEIQHTGRHRDFPLDYVNRQIWSLTNSALKKGLLKVKRQRIQFTTHSPSPKMNTTARVKHFETPSMGIY